MPVLHDPGEGTGVGEPVALELVVEIGVGVELDHGQALVTAGVGPDRGPGDGVVTPESQHPAPVVEEAPEGRLDGVHRRGPGGHLEVAGVEEG